MPIPQGSLECHGFLLLEPQASLDVYTALTWQEQWGSLLDCQL